MAKESAIQKRILDNLYRIDGSDWVKIISANKNGYPDIIGHINGLFVGIEVKKENGHASELQKHRIKKLNARGAIAFVARSWDEVRLQLCERIGPDAIRAKF